MKALLNDLESKGKDVLYMSLDIESDARHFNSQESLIAKLKLELGSGGGFVFIDEIQRKKNAGLFLKGLFDAALPYKFIVSGSGSLELKEKIHESLAGRKRLFTLNTLSLEEFINFKTEYKYEDKLLDFCRIEKIKFDLILKEFMNFGGYPRIALEEDPQEKIHLMDEIYRSYIEKDISFLLNIDKPEAFSKMLKLLAAQSGSLVNYSDIATNTGISVPTLKNYIWYAEKTFAVNLITPFFRNKIKEITKSPVVYFADHGMRNYMLGMFGNLQNPVDAGLVFQNLVYNLLKENFSMGNVGLHYWRTTDKAEVDFVINYGSSVIPIEVKYSKIKKCTLTRSMHSFIEKYQPERAFVVSPDYHDEIKIKNSLVEFISPIEINRVRAETGA